MKYEFSKVLML